MQGVDWTQWGEIPRMYWAATNLISPLAAVRIQSCVGNTFSTGTLWKLSIQIENLFLLRPRTRAVVWMENQIFCKNFMKITKRFIELRRASIR